MSEHTWKSTALFSLVPALTLAAGAAASARTSRYVAPDGDDAGNDCTDTGNPCATISHAVALSSTFEASAGGGISANRVSSGSIELSLSRVTLPHSGVTGGCAANQYCPGDPVSRAQMAVFVTKTFGLALYGL